MRILSAVLFPVLSLAVIGAPSVASAQKKRPEQPPAGPVGKTPGACGVKILPLVQGNQWTYTFVASGQPLRDDLRKLEPTQPNSVVITVKSIETTGPDTVVTLEEKTSTDLSKDPKKHIMDDRTLTTTITCNAKKFEISPDSFFFAGEPGGSFAVTFDKIERPKDTSWKLVNGGIGDAPWREDIIAHFTRTPVPGSGAKLDSGKLELERKFIPAEPERINTKIGLYTAEKLVLQTSGRVTLDHAQRPDIMPVSTPQNWTNQLWLVPNVGIVQVLNAYSHEYMLSAADLK